MTDHNQFEEGLQRQNAREQLNALLGKEVIESLQQRSDLRGAWAALSCVGAIALCMYLIVYVQQFNWYISIPFTVLLIGLLGGRQLAMSILMHEAAHRTLFKTAKLNDFVGDYVFSRPILFHLKKYRKHHALHHTKTGTEEDVDLGLIEGFPTSKISMARKLVRDIVGYTGLRNTLGLILMNAGFLKWSVGGDAQKLPRDSNTGTTYLLRAIKELRVSLLINAVFFVVLLLLGYPELFLAWLAAYIFAFPFVLRIRSIAEHAITERSPDMLLNTRTTRAGLLARMFFAPYRVNYHIEHHALVLVPYWNLPKLHLLLRSKQIIPEPPGYWDVVKLAASKA